MVYPSSKFKGRGFSTRNYTLIVSDLIDTNNSRNTNYGYGSDQTGGTELDQVSGYTIQQIEDVLEDTSSWKDWKNNIKNRYDNDTEEHLDRLFKAYE
jgi:hypothetical protein